VIFDFLGIPLAEWETYQQLLRAYTGSVLPTSQGDTGNPGQRLREYVKGLVAAKRRAPGDDLLTRMIEIHDEDESRLSESELLAQTTGLLAAGYITTVNALARGTVALLHSNQYTALDTNRDRLERAVEEILRYGQSGDTGVLRVATEEVRLGDFVVPRGEAVLTPLAAANRDPDVFPEPDRFDINRRENQHLSFGHGPHHCIGAPLARPELQVGFSALARSLPTLQLAVSYEEALELTVPFIQIPGGGVIVGGSRSLPVAW
jgi:cytochrome P450